MPGIRVVFSRLLAASVLVAAVVCASPALAAAAALGSRPLHQGMHGSDVRTLQIDLTKAGIRTGEDGIFGPQTARSVITFERRYHLRVTSTVTRSFVAKLRSVLAKASIDSAPDTGGAAAVGSSGASAVINANGTATAPAGAPAAVDEVIAAANEIIDKPYVYGGGHGAFTASGYDCSGAVSFALHGARLLAAPEDSTDLESFGSPGKGRWITVYANPSHAFVVVAGRAFDTADYGGPNIPAGSGPRWRANPTGNLADGGHYVVRHPAGL